MRRRVQAVKVRRGMALITALGGIIVIAVMMGGVMFMSTQETRIATGTFSLERAFRAAEYGLNRAVVDWPTQTMLALPNGGIHVMNYGEDGWQSTVRVTRLTDRTYSMVSSATVHPGTPWEGRKSTGLSVRIADVDFNFLGALTVRGSTRIGGSSYITGYDSPPQTWDDCDATVPPMPGVVIPDAGDLTFSGCNNLSCLDGDPKIQESEAADDTTNYFTFGDLDWESLTAMATNVYSGSVTITITQPAVSDGVCLTHVRENWGAPERTSPANPCENHFPVIYFAGEDATVKIQSGSKGQGILLVDGDLEIAGGYEFYGPVIVRGRLRTTGTGGKINGGVMAANVDLEQNTVLGDATIKYSTCAIAQAKQGLAIPLRLVERAWMDVF